MNKETAVEYMFRLLDVMTFDKDSESAKIWQLIYHRALEMEREQILNAYREGRTDQQAGRDEYFNRTSVQYYNETYKGGEQ